MLTQRAENHDLRAGTNHIGSVLRGLFPLFGSCVNLTGTKRFSATRVSSPSNVYVTSRAPMTQSGSCAMIDGEPPFLQASSLVLSASRASSTSNGATR
jgi:hypothetical protein